MEQHQRQTDLIISQYFGKNVQTRLPVNGEKKQLKCIFNSNIGDDFREKNSYYGHKSEGRCIIRLMVHTHSYDDNTMETFLSFMIHKIEVAKYQRHPVVINEQEQASVTTTEDVSKHYIKKEYATD